MQNRSGQRTTTETLGLAVLLAGVLFCAWSSSGLAAERAWIATDGVLSYVGDTWVAVGGVTLVQGETEIQADRLDYVVSDEQAYFTGNVKITRNGDEITGEAFSYNLESSTGELQEASARLHADKVDAPVYLMGDEMEFSEKQTVVHNARLTTCAPPERAGYYLVSRRMDIFPGDRVVIRNVRFIESGVTLFYWPYIVISLRDERPTRMQFPEIGHNSRDGWYAKIRYAYDGPGEGYGEAALDVMQHTGVGTGVSHTYRDEPQSEGRVTAYRLANRQTGHDDLRLGWEESFPLGDHARAALKGAYLTEEGTDGDEAREGRMALALHRTTGGAATHVEWAERRFWGEQEGRIDRVRWTHSSRPAGWRWRIQGEAFSHHLLGEPERDAAEYETSLVKQGGVYELKLELEKRLHRDFLTSNTAEPSWKSVSRFPEGTLRLDLAGLVSPKLPLQLELGFGRIEEVRQIVGEYVPIRADRKRVAFQLKPGSFSMGRLGRLSYRGGAEWQTYTTGEQRGILSADYQYRTPLTDRWSLHGSYTYQDVLGDSSPFSFDAEENRERITGGLRYTHSKGSFGLSTGYDFIDRNVSDLVGHATLRPDSKTYLALQAGYSVASQRPTYAAASVSLRPRGNWSMTASTRYNFAQASLDHLTGSLTLAYLGWRLNYDAVYDGVDEEYDRGDLSLVRDLGCREVGIRYNSAEGEVWLEYRITALPGAGVRVGANENQFMFDPETFSELFSTE